MHNVTRYQAFGQPTLSKLIDYCQTSPFRSNCVILVPDKTFAALRADCAVCFKQPATVIDALNVLYVPGCPPILANKLLPDDTIKLVEPHNLVHTLEFTVPQIWITGVTYY